MHIIEGFLPLQWCLFWFALSLPVVAYGIYRMNNLIKNQRDTLSLLAVSGAFIFVLLSLKLPYVTGSCSHPTGTGLATILFRPWVTSVLSMIVLIYQSSDSLDVQVYPATKERCAVETQCSLA